MPSIPAAVAWDSFTLEEIGPLPAESKDLALLPLGAARPPGPPRLAAETLLRAPELVCTQHPSPPARLRGQGIFVAIIAAVPATQWLECLTPVTPLMHGHQNTKRAE